MTNRQITTLIRQIVANAMYDFFNDPDFGKTVKKSLLRSIENARNEKGRSLTLVQFRKKYGF